MMVPIPGGFFNTEYFVDLKPKAEWRPIFHENKEAVIDAMNRELMKIPGVLWNFSQPIADNMEEAVSGVKGQLAVKIYGEDLKLAGAKGRRDRRGAPQDSRRRRSRIVQGHRPTQSGRNCESRRGRALQHQRRRYSGLRSRQRSEATP